MGVPAMAPTGLQGIVKKMYSIYKLGQANKDLRNFQLNPRDFYGLLSYPRTRRKMCAQSQGNPRVTQKSIKVRLKSLFAQPNVQIVRNFTTVFPSIRNSFHHQYLSCIFYRVGLFVHKILCKREMWHVSISHQPPCSLHTLFSTANVMIKMFHLIFPI